ncbi:hypothetical protein IE81DRAFT_368748 [Ceraceosorus guamensis]|uniref:Something about silencing protein 4 domain-containing protein n=1 Tax=Ceraceosorus guamensis TaxID=1522189 RepID=A0A316VQD1_9BASI|nr:hypothetical protein IE81DRAFT_368748 [Ceraceosorus guamensis]PWN39849.1 hypothetical protein IE81DRAFT_368748 [Ceraceosorus guamensis]
MMSSSNGASPAASSTTLASAATNQLPAVGPIDGDTDLTNGNTSITSHHHQHASTVPQSNLATPVIMQQRKSSPLAASSIQKLGTADILERRPSPLVPLDGVSASMPAAHSSHSKVTEAGRDAAAGQTVTLSASNSTSSLGGTTMDLDDASISQVTHSSSAAPSPANARSGGRRGTPQAEETMGSEARRSRRVLPARLLRVSSILAGGSKEDELGIGTPTKLDQGFLLPNLPIILSSSSVSSAYEHRFLNASGEDFSFFSDPNVARSCRARELIETPEFKPWDEGAMLGKTRALRSEEDMSDAAYERRHRRGDKLEKRQRRLEKEALIRDRQKLKERIDQLKSADARLLMPILHARERHTESRAPTPPGEGSTVKTSANVGLSEGSSSAADTSSKLEHLRAELLGEALETLARYDALLPELVTTAARATPPIAPTATPMEKRSNKRPATEEASASAAEDDESTDSRSAAATAAAVQYAKNKARTAAATAARQRKARERREAAAREAAGLPPLPPTDVASSSTATSSARVIKSTLKRLPSAASAATRPTISLSRRKSAPETSTAASRARTSQALARSVSAVRQNRASLPSLKKPAVYAVKNHFNIHARTSGGRFAPKSALTGAGKAAPLASTPKKVAAASKQLVRSAKSASTASPEPPKRSPRTARREVPSTSTSEERKASGSNRGIRGASGRFIEPPHSLLAYQQRQQANRTGPSLSELEAANKRPRRVKLILGPDKRGHEGDADEVSRTKGTRRSFASRASGSKLTQAAVEALDEDGNSDVDVEVAPAFVPAALTLEQAQALMEAAMAEAGADDDDDGGEMQIDLASLMPPTSTTSAPSTDKTSEAVSSAVQETEDNQMQVDAKKDEQLDDGPSKAVEVQSSGDTIASSGENQTQNGLQSEVEASAPSEEMATSALEAGSPDTPSARYVPGRTAQARARAAASIPARRNSSRVKAASAFGEKIPEQTNKREDFDVTWHAQTQSPGWLQDMVVERAEAQMGSREDSSDIESMQR